MYCFVTGIYYRMVRSEIKINTNLEHSKRFRHRTQINRICLRTKKSEYEQLTVKFQNEPIDDSVDINTIESPKS